MKILVIFLMLVAPLMLMSNQNVFAINFNSEVNRYERRDVEFRGFIKRELSSYATKFGMVLESHPALGDVVFVARTEKKKIGVRIGTLSFLDKNKFNSAIRVIIDFELMVFDDVDKVIYSDVVQASYDSALDEIMTCEAKELFAHILVKDALQHALADPVLKEIILKMRSGYLSWGLSKIF